MPKKFATMEEQRLYNRRHYMVVKARGRAVEHGCSCGKVAAEWAHLKDATGDLPEDYEAMCRPCHHKYDDRWNDEERSRVSESVRAVWDASPERKLEMSLHPHRLRRR
jgi:hypothetical protein